jgi:hypothetical protein
MNKLAPTFLLALLALLGTGAAQAQRDYEDDRRYCASGRSGLDFRSCMRQFRHDREGDERDGYDRDGRERYDRDGRERYERRGYDNRGDYDRRQGQGQGWGEPAPRYEPQWQQPQPERPRLSDMQQRALDNCALLAPRDQPRCRATVMSTVR